jgi:hypothetical protein
MTCIEAESHVSVLYDGEQVPAEAADHIEDCPTCRDTLRTYSHLGAEIRLMASRTQPASVIPEELQQRIRSQKKSWFRFLEGKVLMPRFAIAALAIAILTAIPASITLVHAQSKPLWFQFQLQPTSSNAFPSFYAVKAGYDDQMAWVFASGGEGLPTMVGAHIAVKSIKDGRVELEIALRNFGTGAEFPDRMQQDVAKLQMQPVIYRPTQPLIIPISGGGTMTLTGEVLDHQPEFAWNLPLEPRQDQLIIRSPVLLQDQQVLVNLQGASTIATGSHVAALNSPGVGTFLFGLQESPGAVEAKANWGYLTFNMGGKSYLLTTGAPICGGDQPRTVWVSFGPPFAKTAALGTGPLNVFIPRP